MRISTFSTSLLPILTGANVFHIAAPPVDFLVEVTDSSPSVTAASVSTLSTPVSTTISTKGIESSELKPRHDGALINPDPNGNLDVAVSILDVNADPAIPPAVPPIPTTTPVSEIVTVQWVETKLDSTTRTWIPKTITIHFDTSPSKAPAPGKGSIGMGTLTGEVGKTKVAVLGAAPTQGLGGWRAGVFAAGVAVVGAVV